MNRDFFFDVSTIKSWKGHPTGIPRVVFELEKTLSKQGYMPVYFDQESSRFLHNSNSEPVSFAKHDLLFSAGATWAFESYNSAILSLKERGVHYAHLFYDIIPVLFPHFYGPGFGKAYEKIILELIKLSDLGFTISEASKRDLTKLAIKNGLTAPEIKVVRLGDESVAKPAFEIRSEVKQIENFILTVGTIEFRKNHITLLNSWRYMAELGMDRPNLVIVGRPGWLDSGIEFQVQNDPSISDHILILSNINDSELDWLYRNCLFTVYPSIYEGWGLPIAESFSYGKVCIASNTSSMAEIAPSITLYSHPLLVNEWCEKINRIYTDSAERTQLELSIRNSFSPTPWENTGDQVRLALGETFK